ncbi:MAG: dTDP-4-dehydrorhamnose 3,5-epimerase family protein [Pseudomonadales bacterium]
MAKLETSGNDPLPLGVKSYTLTTHKDERGELTEFYNKSWGLDFDCFQWNIVNSRSNTFRGFHAHLKHSDYLFVPAGKMLLGLVDIRVNSPTFRQSAQVEISPQSSKVWMIPPGVAHGFYFPVESVHCYALTHQWDINEKHGCRWNSPGTNISWPTTEPVLSEIDQSFGDLEDLIEELKDVDFKV